jgi:hypothetical protein
MKKFDIKISDARDIRKVQRMVLILSRMADMFEKYKEIEITVIATPNKKWWKIFK